MHALVYAACRRHTETKLRLLCCGQRPSTHKNKRRRERGGEQELEGGVRDPNTHTHTNVQVQADSPIPMAYVPDADVSMSSFTFTPVIITVMSVQDSSLSRLSLKKQFLCRICHFTSIIFDGNLLVRKKVCDRLQSSNIDEDHFGLQEDLVSICREIILIFGRLSHTCFL